VKVNRKSWHSKISNLGDYPTSGDNLCRYFWRIVIKSGVICFAITLMGTALYQLIISGAAVFIGAMALYIILTVTLPVLAITQLRKKLGKPPEASYEPILKAYIKAKKEKVCPIIEYVD